MIRIAIDRRPDGTFSMISSKGHGRIENGSSLVCGIVTAALKGFGRTLTLESGFEISGQTGGPGDLVMKITRVPAERLQWVLGVQDLFLGILTDARQDFPEELKIQIT